MTGLCCDDGENRILLVSFDLLALDAWRIARLRRTCGDLLGIPECGVMLTCTHNHSGPQTITEAGHENLLNTRYLEKLEKTLLAETAALKNKFRPADVYFYSMQVDENLNRRYTTSDNVASFLPHRAECRPIAKGVADQELGSIIFLDPETQLPVYVIGNYAAHPLAGHAPGLGSLRFSADFPGAFRNYVLSETGAECMFVSGAAGDMIPREDELGSKAAEDMGERLGKAMVRSMVDAPRNPGRFKLDPPRVGSLLRNFSAPLRYTWRNNPAKLTKEYRGRDDIQMQFQCLAVGDICFIGVPGELCAELGLELKWHSPFRRTFIAYEATGYIDYICPANFFVAGGYEPKSHRFSARSTIDFVKAGVDALFDLHESMYPSPAGKPYPDGLDLPLVSIPPNRRAN